MSSLRLWVGLVMAGFAPGCVSPLTGERMSGGPAPEGPGMTLVRATDLKPEDGASGGKGKVADKEKTNRDGKDTDRREAGKDDGKKTPDLHKPGPDSPDFPNSAFTVPPGVVYVETSLTSTRDRRNATTDRFTNTLIRFGVLEDLEVLVSTPGLIVRNQPDRSTVTGFGPLTFGAKRHVWDADQATGRPAFAVGPQLTAPTGSAPFDNGAWVPTLVFYFDHALPRDFNFEWNAAVSAIKAGNGRRVAQGYFPWSLSRDWTPDFTTFVNGYVAIPSTSGVRSEAVVGLGFLWYVSAQVALDGSYNVGLTSRSSSRLVRLGLSFAF